MRDVLLGLDEWAPFFADQALRVRAAHPASAMRHHLLAIHATLATPCGDVPVVPIIG